MGQADNLKISNKINSLTEIVDNWLIASCQSFADRNLDRACCYSLEAPGKRLRPVLALISGELLGVSQQQLKSFALALEYLHTASLIHDDLPAMDDDSLRRGRPTCHVEFGEAIALLAGDRLISKAFSLIAASREYSDTEKVELLKLLSNCFDDLCIGQASDIEAKADTSKDELYQRHLQKTASLICTSVIGPCYFLPEEQSIKETVRLSKYGIKLGLLFQITDDILDVTQSSEQLGKPSASDVRRDTPTFVTLYGLDGAREKAREVATDAIAALADYGDKASDLRELVQFVLTREK